MRRALLAAVTTAVAALAAAGADAATPAGGTVSGGATTASWTGGPFATSNPNPAGLCLDLDPSCDRYSLTIQPPGGAFNVRVAITPSSEAHDYDLFVEDANGTRIASSAGETGNEAVVLTNPAAGTYTVRVLAWNAVGGSYSGTATLTPVTGGGPPPSDPNSVKWTYDASAPQASVEVPLRVVMVGFQPGELNESALVGEVPDTQRPGVLIPRGTDSSGDAFPLFGAETLVNHGRNYYNDSTPFLVPYEYRWKRQVIYASDAFANGLFAAMKASSTTGDYSKSANRQFLETYNATRGVYRGAANQVLPNTPVRFVDGEKVEDWIAANAPTLLGFDFAARGKGPGRNPGYTVFVLNTWDSPAARTHLQPQREYHVWRIDRTDPDTKDFDGIDWARIWGGRYRFMMADLGAAPNPYEAESWANRNRTTYGSANYDPPLWEYRAGAPRPATLVNLGEGVEQAVTPGARWDTDQLNRMVGRTVGQAASFRFLHSYLYEPYPATGSYWLSSNVWHDAKAAVPWASDLTKLYDQSVALAGLRTLTPYLRFDGDVSFEYLQEGGADYTADQAMLDQAKQDGDDVAGAPGTAMRTETAMSYIDASPRLFRGGPCFTTVPNINVVAEKHYAWALAIAAGIATNRNGVPWGYLGSVNDVFKTPQADRDQSMSFAHPSIGTGAFTYTVVHEASHYLGLAHPHDSIGATRNADGSPRYYDGFTWAFNSTAAPTTYSHTELVYSILDQENMARGHAAYYLKWSDEALADAGEAYAAAGVTTLAQLPAAAARLRTRAVNASKDAESRFAKFDFVQATFAAQRAWRAAAAFRDLARGLAPGTTELEKGTKKEGASACASAKEQGR